MDTLQETGNFADSVAAVLQEAPDSSKARVCNEISWNVHREHPDVALAYALKAIEYAEESNNQRELCMAYTWAGVNLRTLGEVAKAIDYYNKSIEVSRNLGWQLEEAYGYINLGVIYCFQENYADAETFLKRAESIGSKNHDQRMLGYIYGYMGETYRGLSQYDKALQYLDKAYKIRQEIDDQAALNAIDKSIGNVYFSSKNYPKAKEYYRNVLDKNRTNPDIEQLSGISLNMAQIYYEENSLDTALHFANFALGVGQRMGNKTHIKNAYKILGFIYYAKHDNYNAAQNLMAELAYNDSIEHAGRAQKMFDVQSVMAKYQKEEEIRKINDSSKIQALVLIVALVLLGLAVLAFAWLRYNRRRVSLLNETLSSQKKQITDSISYARKIQDAILPEDGAFGRGFSDNFVLYKPKETVSGNLYWYYETNACEIVAVADCISRNVAGAFMTLQACTALQEIASSGLMDAGEVLRKLKLTLRGIMKHDNKKQGSTTNINIALLIIDKETRMLDYTGAKLPMAHIRNGKTTILNPMPYSTGQLSDTGKFDSEKLQLMPGDCIYLSADGFVPNTGKHQTQKTYTDLLAQNSNADMACQKAAIEKMYADAEALADDICVVGFRI
ncbi:MAG: tetratricopeptide repeat protein [Bacteroidales bacterium]|nr:tetratricopeptide repeat protein [Bacteroidales bacterium]